MSEKGKRPPQAKQQDPTGVLNAEPIGRYKTIGEDFLDLPVDSIQPHDLIPDYRDPTESTHPIVVQSQEACFCIDGWNLIEMARARAQQDIRCHVFQIERHSETELALRKAGIRTKPLGGVANYAEIVRNTKILEAKLMMERDSLIAFSHGGVRRGEQFTNNKEDDLRVILVERMGKDRNTINDYLNFGRYLTNAAMEIMVAEGAGKRFFEKIRVRKRTFVHNLQSDGLDDGAITNQASEQMLQWWGEFQSTGDIATAPPVEENPDPESEIERPELSNGAEARGRSQQELGYRSPSPTETLPDMPDEAEALTDLHAVIAALIELAEQSAIATNLGVEVVGNQIKALAMIRQMLIDIRDRANDGRDKEAA